MGMQLVAALIEDSGFVSSTYTAAPNLPKLQFHGSSALSDLNELQKLTNGVQTYTQVNPHKHWGKNSTP